MRCREIEKRREQHAPENHKGAEGPATPCAPLRTRGRELAGRNGIRLCMLAHRDSFVWNLSVGDFRPVFGSLGCGPCQSAASRLLMHIIHVGCEGLGHSLFELDEFKSRPIHDLPFTSGHRYDLSDGGADCSGQHLQFKTLNREEEAIDLTHPHTYGVLHECT